MLDLPYSSVEKDIQMIDEVIDCGLWDCIKIYPFAVLNSYLNQKDKGATRLYSQDEPKAVFSVMKYALMKLPVICVLLAHKEIFHLTL